MMHFEDGDSKHTETDESKYLLYSSDIYSTGILLNEIMTDKVPWSNLRYNNLIPYLVAKEGKRPELFVCQSNSADEKSMTELIGDSTAGCLSQSRSARPNAASVYQELSRLVENQLLLKKSNSVLLIIVFIFENGILILVIILLGIPELKEPVH